MILHSNWKVWMKWHPHLFIFKFSGLKVKISADHIWKYEQAHDKTYIMAYVPREDSDQPGRRPSLIIAVCAVGSWGPKLSSCREQRPWSDWADAQADLSLCLAQMPLCRFCHVQAHIINLDISFHTDQGWNVRLYFQESVNKMHHSSADFEYAWRLKSGECSWYWRYSFILQT